ncbi:hypothetical protein EAE32_06445 [Kocuria tytonicola]|uniref:Chromosome partition protein Smc n=1 Tax=Kocuria tytonicola TaxID=2055946 RepID=A0A3L9L9A3_9MICC|nr:hypothetical protein [Kocuria tytonicola]RLY94774.1 hypothetical protein EAE32_06445 [Kocuria tytonicola]
MSGYVYRGARPEPQTALTQQNQALAAELETARKRIAQLSSTVSQLSDARDRARTEARAATRQLDQARTEAAAAASSAPSQDVAVHRARVRALLVAVRTERDEAARATQDHAAEHARRTHAEAELSRVEDTLAQLRAEVTEDHQARAKNVLTESTTARENTRLTQRVAELQGALTDCQQMRTEALADRDRALAEALTVQGVLDAAHSTITEALPAVWAIRRHHNEIKKEVA